MVRPRALIRTVPSSFDRALRHAPTAIDVPRARAQHDEYRHQLELSGYEVEVVPAVETQPDCVFIEDTAVIIGDIAVITRPGAPSRREETGSVADALERHFQVVEIEPPGTLDGGDVFVTGGTVYVGRSTRTNKEGIDQLRSVAGEHGLGLVTIAVDGALHLKSAVLPVDGETVVVTPDAVDEDHLEGFRILREDPSERHRFSALPLADGRVLVTSSAPITAEMLSGHGSDVAPIDVSEFQAADGGLTCMSILF